ncbi:arginine/serine-rich protein PNISR-like [Battus philenor]|uniref:arginine/serine-rich protein PNISR-like n=1 Tax=Battus philenor TaxID=42288 RepID=UPI0035CF44DD
MFSSKDAVNPAYPTQWALNPTAYQNIDSSQVDWAALAQQWIAMKEAAAIVTVPQPPQPPPKPDIEGGEAPMEVENPELNCESVVPPDAEWNSATNSWGNSWNQWGWGWGGNDSKLPADPTLSVPPMMDGYPVPPDNSTPMPGYTTGPVPAPTFQHGYWTASQGEQSNSRGSSRNRDHRSKSKTRDTKPNRTRQHRDKIPMIPPIIDPIAMPMAGVTPTIDAAKRRQLPGWIREGLEKMEREKQKAIEREQEKKAREEAEKEKKRLEEEELQRLKAEASGQPMLPPKSKFDSDSESEEPMKKEKSILKTEPSVQEEIPVDREVKEEPDEKPTLIKKSKEEIMQEVMFAVRRSLTEILLEVTDQEIHTVSQEELARYNAAQASHLNAMKASKSKALAAIATGLGLGAYESSSDSSSDEDDQRDLSDQQLQEIIKRKRQEFERTARDIEAEVRRAELRENVEEPSTPVTTPEKPKRPRSSATPPPLEIESPDKKPERRTSKDKRSNHKPIDKVDNRRLASIPEEKVKKTCKWENTPSPKTKTTSEKGSSSSSSSDSDDSSSSSSDSSTRSDQEIKVTRSKKRRRRSSSASDTKKSKNEKQKKSYKSNDRISKSKQNESDRYHKSRSEKKDDYAKHKSKNEKTQKDKYRDDSEESRPRKRSRRSTSYESRGKKKISRDRSEERSRRRDKRSYDRDRSYDRSGRDHDRSGRDHDRSGRDHDRSGRDYGKHDRYERRRSKSRSHSRHHR